MSLDPKRKALLDVIAASLKHAKNGDSICDIGINDEILPDRWNDRRNVVHTKDINWKTRKAERWRSNQHSGKLGKTNDINFHVVEQSPKALDVGMEYAWFRQ